VAEKEPEKMKHAKQETADLEIRQLCPEEAIYHRRQEEWPSGQRRLCPTPKQGNPSDSPFHAAKMERWLQHILQPSHRKHFSKTTKQGFTVQSNVLFLAGFYI
jgi:hypothetical protein